MDSNWDFKGWCIYYNELRRDGTIIDEHTFDDQKEIKVPLFIDNGVLHVNDITNCIGHAILEPRKEGVYCYGYFLNNLDAPQIVNVKELLQEGKLRYLGVYANHVKRIIEDSVHFTYARIVSVVLFNTNPLSKNTRIEVIQI